MADVSCESYASAASIGCFGIWLHKSSERLSEVANRQRVCKDVFDDSRNIMNELKTMELSPA